MQNRTDLALELKEEKNIGSAQSGIIVKTRIDTTNHIKETKIIIKNKKGEDSLGKPKGTYITIEAKDLSTNDGSFHKEMSEALFLNLSNPSFTSTCSPNKFKLLGFSLGVISVSMSFEHDINTKENSKTTENRFFMRIIILLLINREFTI